MGIEKPFFKQSVILSLSKDQFRTSEKRQTELILRQAQDDGGGKAARPEKSGPIAFQIIM
jgi:hypothetical protein